MDFNLTPAEQAFREELSEWVRRERPESTPAPKLDTWEDRARAFRRWQERLFDIGERIVGLPKGAARSDVK